MSSDENLVGLPFSANARVVSRKLDVTIGHVISGFRRRDETGQVIGSTDSKGSDPRKNSLEPNDLLATVYSFLGIDLDHSYPDRSGRPMPVLPYGRPIAGLT